MADSLYVDPITKLGELIASIQANGSKITDFSEGGGTRDFFEAIGTALSNQTLIAEQFRQDSSLATATGDALDAKGADNQVDRNPAVAAAGTVRISRAAAGAAVTIPAGWGALQTIPAVGQTPAQFLTTQDAIFGGADLFKDVQAIAITPGVIGNVADQTVLIPVNPVGGFQTNGGFKAQGAFTNGVDVESDDAYRTRIPITVQGRTKGQRNSYLAAALGIPGVLSANVLQAGDTRANLTVVPAGVVEVYYEGAAGLLTSVQTAVLNAAVLNQAATAFQATALQTIVNLTVFAKTGIDTVALIAAVKAAVQASVNAVPVGGLGALGAGKGYYADAINAARLVAGVVSVQLPFGDFRLSTSAPGTAADLVIPVNAYPSLAAVDCGVTVVLL